MKEHFRVAQKIGLMFRPEEPLPKDVKSWALKQLHSSSIALGIESVGSEVKPWPKSLQPDLDQRAAMWRLYRENVKKQRAKIEGYDSQVAIKANRENNRIFKHDMLKFSHRNIFGKDQLRIRLMSFWNNHFTIGSFDSREVIGHAMEEAILANLNGSFSTMLYKVITHPGMLTYLDNHISAGPNSKKVARAKRNGKQAGLNDNLGRELLELHTVSPSANYTEEDIKNTAKVLAGWGTWFDSPIKELMEDGGTTNHWDFYKNDYAEPGNKTVLGKTIGTGKGGLKQLTDFLANHEHTINYISFKLAEHFVSDSPSEADINHIASAWRANKGDLDEIHSAVIERAVLSKEPKFQWPMNWLFQVIRLSNARYFKGWSEIYSHSNARMNTDKIFEELGQSFWEVRQPNGYSSKKDDWMSGEMFERRIRFAEAIWNTDPRIEKVDNIMERIGANNSTKKLVASVGMSKKAQFISLMCSPELMGLENA